MAYKWFHSTERKQSYKISFYSTSTVRLNDDGSHDNINIYQILQKENLPPCVRFRPVSAMLLIMSVPMTNCARLHDHIRRLPSRLRENKYVSRPMECSTILTAMSPSLALPLHPKHWFDLVPTLNLNKILSQQAWNVT